jgi:hypothetical protein
MYIYKLAVVFAVFGVLSIAGIGGMTYFLTEDRRKTVMSMVLGALPVVFAILWVQSALFYCNR